MSIPTQVQELIDSSGNNFHSKVARWFAADSWTLQVSPYYLDPTQQKAREIDLIAEKSWQFKNSFGQFVGHILVRIYIECKFVPAHAVFWFSDKNRKDAEGLVCSFGGFTPNNTYSSKHHYLSQGSRVAKLFTSSQSKQQEADLFYKALNQILSAFVALRNEPASSATDRLRGQIVVLNYPVVVCSSFDNIYAEDFLGQAETAPQRDNFQLEVRYAHGEAQALKKNEYFLIDMVSFDGLLTFKKAIEDDVDAAIFLNGH